jgi:hypothetical protein
MMIENKGGRCGRLPFSGTTKPFAFLRVQIRNILAKRGGQVNLMILLVDEDLSE